METRPQLDDEDRNMCTSIGIQPHFCSSKALVRGPQPVPYGIPLMAINVLI